MQYSTQGMVKAMKIQEIILRAVSGKIHWTEAAEIIGVSYRTMKRWKKKYEEYGYDGLFDRRMQTPSPKKVPLNELEKIYQSVADTTKTLSTGVRGILIEAGACLAAIEGIIWDMSGFTSRIEAEDMINILRDAALRGLSVLRDKKTQEFIKGA